ncbi:MAG: cytidine deaminase [Microcystis wesenbergii TW10]|jgi:cytidine deaminase|uniref:Cytidine deaminase n=3 Tax=Microcystis TaxID=1125 RepID=A0A0A1VZK1_MICAE|nr:MULTISPECIES: cytidine deaminase [Microcystis]MCZ8099037.1 cytidine deaminase [Burkholderiales bacterium]MDT3673634.1 cytidine deaminase [Microcystis wesenbergii NRERC-220]REJ52764.1 MAG: cytidine deaminase [Microcystis wesenbergii TW10]GAL94969.1 cytidine deaminase [Microcystis aeruginosa NIES-44]
MTLSDQERQQLCDTAREVAKLSYSPYSRFRVGAAVLTNKKIYAGTNVENASYGLSLCAERATLAQIIAAGDREVRAIAIACIDGVDKDDISQLTPCGACRQWMAELAPKAEIIICGTQQNYRFNLSDLLPFSFRF